MIPKPLARLIVGGLAAFCALGFQRGAPRPAAADPEAAYRANNVGISYLEQFDYDKAATAFRQALAIDSALGIARFNLALSLFYGNDGDGALTEARAAAERLPESPQAHYLLGLLARSQNRTADAIAEFKQVLQRDSDDVGTKVNLGQVYLQERTYDAAVSLLKEAIAAEPYNVTAAYNLATALTRSGGQEAGRAAMDRFQTLRDSAYGNTYAQTYLAQGKYAEAMTSTGAEPELVNQAMPKVAFTDATATMLASTGPIGAAVAQPDASTLTVLTSGVTLFDRDGDGDLDLLSAGTTGLKLYDNARGVLTERPLAIAGSNAGDAAVGAVAADYDNDGRSDLFVLGQTGNRLLHQRPDGGFDDVTAKAGLSATVQSRSAAFADVDHDGDLDLFIAAYRGVPAPGGAAAPVSSASNQLLRNNGDGTFTDITEAAKVTGGEPAGIGVVPTDFDNRRDLDLLVVHQNAAPTLFQNMRDGSFRDVAAEVRLPAAARFSSVAAADVNKDGYTDFYFGDANGPGTFAMSDGNGHFVTAPGPDVAGAAAAQFVDIDNDGILDLVVLSSGLRVFRHVGTQWMALPPGPSAPAPASFQAMATGDLDGDGDEDIVVRLSTGELRVWRNDGGNAGRSLAVKLAGRVSNRGGIGSKVDMRAGSLRQRLESSAATPAVAPADLIFGLGARARADAVRVLWPSGTLQAEVDPGATGTAAAPAAASTLTVTELDRKPSSCPYLYTWNGSRFEFVTDFMGGGELGYWLSPHEWHQPDPDEYVRIREDQLTPRNGRYEIRITNELEETMYVDRLQLIAVDHPADAEAYPNEGLKEGAPGFGLTTTRGARPVASATDDRGRNVRDRLAAIDRAYVDGFPLSPIRGYAETHTLTLDLGVDANRAVLLMTGWTDYAFSADNVAASHSGRSLTAPSLEVQDASGAWLTIVDDIGIPVGRPQTVVVNLRGKAPAGAHIVRIVTNMRIYWDQVLVDSSGGDAGTVLTRLDPDDADLHWRGFSAEVSPDGREPYGYDYGRVATVSPWKQMTGRYTREGDVRPLLTAVDDLFVVSRPGDEIALSFDASRLPALKPGTRRTFLLYADGYSKEMDINSASPDSVEPMPFHGMTAFPYGPAEHYPRTPAHEDYLATFNTRG